MSRRRMGVMPTVVVTIRIPEDELAVFDAELQKAGVARGEVMRRLIGRWLRARRGASRLKALAPLLALAIVAQSCARARAATPPAESSPPDLGPHAMTCAEVVVIGAENTTRCENDEIVCYAGFGCIPHR